MFRSGGAPVHYSLTIMYTPGLCTACEALLWNWSNNSVHHVRVWLLT